MASAKRIIESRSKTASDAVSTSATGSNGAGDSGTDQGSHKRGRAKALRLKDLTPGRAQILEHLMGRQWGLTSHINELAQPGKLVQHTQRDLKWLAEMGFVSRFVARPEEGRASPYGWSLTRAGAEILGRGDDWDNHFLRQPTYYALRVRENELQLRRAVTKMQDQITEQGLTKPRQLSLISPHLYSKARPIPNTTEQFQTLYNSTFIREYIRVVIAHADGQANWESRMNILNAKTSPALLAVPKQSNDYVLFVPNSKGVPANQLEIDQLTAFVMVLCPPDVSSVFLQKRIELYKSLKATHQKLHIVAVFEDERHMSQTYRKILKEAKWDWILLEKLTEQLVSYWREDLNARGVWQASQTRIDTEALLAVQEKARQEKLLAQQNERSRRKLDEFARQEALRQEEEAAAQRIAAEQEQEAARQEALKKQRGLLSFFGKGKGDSGGNG